MLINYSKSNFLLIRIKIRKKKKWGFMFPIPLFIISELIDAIEDLSLFFGNIILPFNKKKDEHQIRQCIQDKASLRYNNLKELTTMFSLFWDDLRSYGKWKMVDIDTGDIFVSIEFY
jgi:hypothetical protein